MPAARHGALILFTAGILGLSGCGGGSADNAAPAPPTTAASPSATTDPPPGATTAPPAVPETLKFSGQTVDGAEFDAATLAGKPVVLWFWAAWCPKCRAAAAEVKKIQQEYRDRVHVVGVAGLGSGAAGMRDFVADYGFQSFPNLADDAGVVWRKFGVTTQEYYVILDARGTIVHKGPLTTAALRDRAAALAG